MEAVMSMDIQGQPATLIRKINERFAYPEKKKKKKKTTLLPWVLCD